MSSQEQMTAAAPEAPPHQTIALRDGSELQIYKLQCPVEPALRGPVTAILNTEWPNGDFYWNESMAGDYADSLTVVMCPAMREGRWVGNATVAFAANSPEVGAVCDVMTHPDARGLGVARAATQAVTCHAVECGARAVYLGTERAGSAQRVYQRIGFEWFHGGVMRHLSAHGQDFDETYFASGQRTSTRAAEWGDLPGVSALFGQPYAMLAGDCARGLFSPARTFHGRCVSVFPYIYYDVLAKAGSCRVLVGQTPHRILGLATMTPIDTAYRRHVGVLDVMTQDRFAEDGPRLLRDTIDSARQTGMRRGVAYVPSTDTLKAQWVRDQGGRSVGTMPEQIKLDEGSIDVEIFEISL